MSFLSKIKKGLGIGTLDAKLNVPGQIAGSSGQLEGDFTLTAKSDQQVKEVKVKFELIQHWDEIKRRRDSNGREESYTSHESRSFELGNYNDKTPFEMKSGEVKTVHFAIPFQPFNPQSSGGSGGQGGLAAVMGAISQVASTLRNEHIEYKVEGKVDLEGVALDPKDVKSIFVI